MYPEPKFKIGDKVRYMSVVTTIAIEGQITDYIWSNKHDNWFYVLEVPEIPNQFLLCIEHRLSWIN